MESHRRLGWLDRRPAPGRRPRRRDREPASAGCSPAARPRAADGDAPTPREGGRGSTRVPGAPHGVACARCSRPAGRSRRAASGGRRTVARRARPVANRPGGDGPPTGCCERCCVCSTSTRRLTQRSTGWDRRPSRPTLFASVTAGGHTSHENGLDVDVYYLCSRAGSASRSLPATSIRRGAAPGRPVRGSRRQVRFRRLPHRATGRGRRAGDSPPRESPPRSDLPRARTARNRAPRGSEAGYRLSPAARRGVARETR